MSTREGGTTARTRDLAEIDGIAAEWDDLVDRTGASPFLRPGWFMAWWRAFGHGRLTILTTRKDDRLAGVLPVVRAGGVARSPTNWHSHRFGPVAEDDGAAADLTETLLARRPRMLSFSFVDEDDPGLGPFRDRLARAGFQQLHREQLRSLSVPTDGDWVEYRNALGSDFRGKLGRSRRRLEELGTVRVDVIQGAETPGQLDALIDEAFRVEASGWKGRAGTAISSGRATERFYRDVAHWAASRGALALSMLRLDGRAIAMEIALEEGGHHLGLKAGFDEEFGRFGPSLLMFHDLIARNFSLGLSTFDFLGGDDEWKRRWLPRPRRMLHVSAFAPTFGGVGRWLAHRYGRPAGKKLQEVAGRLRSRPEVRPRRPAS